MKRSAERGQEVRFHPDPCQGNVLLLKAYFKGGKGLKNCEQYAGWSACVRGRNQRNVLGGSHRNGISMVSMCGQKPSGEEVSLASATL